MKIALVGYGKMGKIIEKVAISRGHEIVARIDVSNNNQLDTVKADVAIEFSHFAAAFENISKCLHKGIPVVSGTTGWLERKHEIDELTAKLNGSFFYASNYSLGVNIFFKINEYLASMMKNLDDYGIALEEIHHTEKKDSPSGTAITLAEGILKHHYQKKKWVNKKASSPEELEIKSLRVDQVPGTHSVKYSSPIDDIEVKHTAHTREGFALGAVMVAEWLKSRKGVLNMNDFLKF